MHHTTAGLLSTTKIVMSAPLPRVFEDIGGKVQPVGTGPGSANAVIGGEFKSDDLTRATKEVVCLVHHMMLEYRSNLTIF